MGRLNFVPPGSTPARDLILNDPREASRPSLELRPISGRIGRPWPGCAGDRQGLSPGARHGRGRRQRSKMEGSPAWRRLRCFSDHIGDDMDGTPSIFDRTRIVALVRDKGAGFTADLVVNVVLPTAIYFCLNSELGDVQALLWSSAPPVLWSIVEFIRARRIDAISMLVLAGIALSLVAPDRRRRGALAPASREARDRDHRGGLPGLRDDRSSAHLRARAGRRTGGSRAATPRASRSSPPMSGSAA